MSPRQFSCVALLVALAVSLAGCGNYPPGPGQVVDNYLFALSEGQFTSACSYLDPPARAAMAARHQTCMTALTRCIPSKAITLSKDQTQFLYSGIQATVTGSKASATVSGTAVANAVKAVTLAKERGNWRLTSYGRGLRRCVRRSKA